MNLAQVKAELGIGTLNLSTATTAEGEKTDWFRHWDNDNRVAVSIHKDTVKDIKENPDTKALAIQHELREGPKGEYDAYRIVMYNEEPEVVL